MIKGIGTDILEIEKLRPILAQPDYCNDSFIRKTYTPAEIALAESRPVPLYCYATRFAGKEAVFKALTVSGEDIRLNEIEILSEESGKPYVTLHGLAEKLAAKADIHTIHISLSYEDNYAVAYAVAE